MLALDYPNREIIVVDNAPCQQQNCRIRRAITCTLRQRRTARIGLGAKSRRSRKPATKLLLLPTTTRGPIEVGCGPLLRVLPIPEVMAVSGLVAAGRTGNLAATFSLNSVYGGIAPTYLDRL